MNQNNIKYEKVLVTRTTVGRSETFKLEAGNLTQTRKLDLNLDGDYWVEHIAITVYNQDGAVLPTMQARPEIRLHVISKHDDASWFGQEGLDIFTLHDVSKSLQWRGKAIPKESGWLTLKVEVTDAVSPGIINYPIQVRVEFIGSKGEATTGEGGRLVN